jgi:Rne/Rng family ribonuclease
MAKNLLVINVDLRETRVALIEEGIIAELHVERASTRSTLGNIVLGKVSRVLPGMQAAFIDIGEERAAFLHVEDLIRPDDFEAYLTGGKRPEEDDSAAEEPAEAVQVPNPAAIGATGATAGAPAVLPALAPPGRRKLRCSKKMQPTTETTWRKVRAPTRGR